MLTVKIVLADDHAVLRAGLREVLAHVAGWEVVAEATDGFEVLTMVNQHNPDVLILDLVMPNLGGLEALHRLKRTHPQVSVLVLSSRTDEVAAREAIQYGANGYITKASSPTELELAIKAVSKGHTYISPEVCAGVLSSSGSIRTSALSELSAREREITKLLCEGKPNRDVAKLLHISARTVDSHRANILKKLGLKSNAELTQLALREGLIE